jgi:hypothetical protein
VDAARWSRVQELTKLAEDVWPKADKSMRQRMAPLAAGSAWNLRLWRNIEDYIGVMPDNTVRARPTLFSTSSRTRAANRPP